MKKMIIGLLIILSVLSIYIFLKPEQKIPTTTDIKNQIPAADTSTKQPTQKSNLKTTTVKSASSGKTLTLSHSNTLTAIPRGAEFAPEILGLIDNDAQIIGFGVSEILSSQMVESRTFFATLRSADKLKYVDEHKYSNYTVTEYLDPNLNQKNWLVDFGNYGMQVIDYSEGKYLINWSSIKFK